ncbi:MAG: nuclear transport factor 2 family protein [Ktedonobacteraceae bacterium]
MAGYRGFRHSNSHNCHTIVPVSYLARHPFRFRDALFKTISTLDSAVFSAFNHCSAPEQLQKYASYFTPDVEFYHDTGGVTWSRKDMIDNTRKNACGKYRRELVPGSLKVFPIKGYGAIEQGVHRFCNIKTGKCTGIANFVIIWRHQCKKWEITRALSYGHRPIKQASIKKSGRGPDCASLENMK